MSEKSRKCGRGGCIQKRRAAAHDGGKKRMRHLNGLLAVQQVPPSGTAFSVYLRIYLTSEPMYLPVARDTRNMLSLLDHLPQGGKTVISGCNVSSDWAETSSQWWTSSINLRICMYLRISDEECVSINIFTIDKGTIKGIKLDVRSYS